MEKLVKITESGKEDLKADKLTTNIPFQKRCPEAKPTD